MFRTARYFNPPLSWRMWNFFPRALGLAALVSVYGCSFRTAPLWEEFSGAKAFAHVQHLVELGPRPAGSEALEKSRIYIADQLKSFGWTDNTIGIFGADTTRNDDIRKLGRAFRERKKGPAQFLLCSHYDTKTFDAIRFVGANDGGSSTGLLIEMARVLAINPALAAKVELVVFRRRGSIRKFYCHRWSLWQPSFCIGVA